MTWLKGKRQRWAKLPWGKSPFDLMRPFEVVRFAKLAYAALGAARSTLAQAQMMDPKNPYWSHGSGADALAQVEFAMMKVVNHPKDRDRVWRQYYRPAGPMLFEGCVNAGGWATHAPWMWCDACKQGFGGLPQLPPSTTCTFCLGPLRPQRLDEVENYVEETP